MAPYKNIAIIGASGNIGKIILDSLVASSQFNITILSRKESQATTATATFPAGVTIRKTDFSNPHDIEAAFKGQDAVISAVGASAFGEQKKLVDAAVRAGVKRFIPSEFSASSQDEFVLQLLPLFGQKKEIVEYLKTKQAENTTTSSKLSWTGIATASLFDWGLRNGFLGFDIPSRTATIWDGGNKSFTLTNEKPLGQAVVSVLQNPQETSNRYIHIASVQTTQNEILSALEKETKAKWTVNDTTTKEQVDEGFEKLGAGDFSGAFALVRATSFGDVPGLHADYVKDEGLDNDVLGLELEDVRDVVKGIITG